MVRVKITIHVDGRVLARAKKKAEAANKTLKQAISEFLKKLGDDDPERDMKEFRSLSDRGNSRGWRFNRNEIYERSNRRAKSL